MGPYSRCLVSSLFQQVLGLALLIGYANQGISRVFYRFGKVAFRYASPVVRVLR